MSYVYNEDDVARDLEGGEAISNEPTSLFGRIFPNRYNTSTIAEDESAESETTTKRGYEKITCRADYIKRMKEQKRSQINNSYTENDDLKEEENLSDNSKLSDDDYEEIFLLLEEEEDKEIEKDIENELIEYFQNKETEELLPKEESNKETKLTVQLPESLVTKLKLKSQISKISIKSLVEEALEDHLEGLKEELLELF